MMDVSQRPLKDGDRQGRLYPALYEVNTRVALADLSRSLGRPATLDDVPDDALDSLRQAGFDWIWLLGIWRTGLAGQRVSRTNPQWRREFSRILPDLREEDIAGSSFAIVSYSVPPALGGDAALARLRDRLRRRGLLLMLDFVPNHTALDHSWVEDHPDYYVTGTALDLERSPENYIRLETAAGERIFAHGRDPYFPGWPDTLQLNYGNPGTQEAMIGELTGIAARCDGVRCDMAMLLQPDVFQRSWDIAVQPFWRRAIEHVRCKVPGFRFMAEVYWDLERALLEQGFDHAYDKRLYDLLRAGRAKPVREHLQAGTDHPTRFVRFLENHDEPRAAATFPVPLHQAAALVTYLSPGMRFFHQGQLEGRIARISPHLARGPDEAANPPVQSFYGSLLPLLHRPPVSGGRWRLLDCRPAWEGNWTWDCFIAWAWEQDDHRILALVNYSEHQSQCYLPLPWLDLAGQTVCLDDLLSASCYERDGHDMLSQGLYLDLPPWGRHVFEISTSSRPAGTRRADG